MIEPAVFLGIAYGAVTVVLAAYLRSLMAKQKKLQMKIDAKSGRLPAQKDKK